MNLWKGTVVEWAERHGYATEGCEFNSGLHRLTT